MPLSTSEVARVDREEARVVVERGAGPIASWRDIVAHVPAEKPAETIRHRAVVVRHVARLAVGQGC